MGRIMKNVRRVGAATAIAVACALSMKVSAQGAEAVTRIDLPPQSLAEAIQAVARQASVNILVDPRLIEGRRAPAVKAEMSIQDVLNVLLHGTGLTPRYVDEKTITLVATPAATATNISADKSQLAVTRLHVAQAEQSLQIAESAGPAAATADAQTADTVSRERSRAESDPVLEEIVVTSDRKSSFSADLVQAGSFRGARQLDIPLTVNVITSEVLESQQVVDLIDALRNTAGVSSISNGPVVYNNLAIRGIPVDTRSNFKLNGSLNILSSIAFPLENKDRLEVLKGASALYYGFSNPSGIVNLTMKRPTPQRLFDATLFGDSNEGFGSAVDYGNTWGAFGARLNAVYAHLDSGIKYSDGHRYLVSGAFDFKPTDRVTVSLDVEHFEKAIIEPATFRFLTSPTPTLANPYPRIALPPLLDARHNFGASWTENDANETNVLGRVSWYINDAWNLTVDGGQSSLHRIRYLPALNPTNLETGAGTLRISAQDARFDNVNYRVELAGAFNIGPLVNEIIVGGARGIKDSKAPVATRLDVPQNFYHPTDIATRVRPNSIGETTRIDDLGFYVFEKIKYGDWLQILGGIRRSDYTESNETTGVETFSAKPTSYSYGLVLQPTEWLSIYGTYIEGLESTSPAPSTAVNANVQLPPSESEQKEAGIKIEPRRGLLGQVAYFDIERGSAYVNGSNVYVLDGLARYRGVEISLTGEVTNDLSLYVSAVFLDAEQISGAPTRLTPMFSPTAVGKRIEGTSEKTASLAAEYRLSSLIEGLKVTGGVYYVGDQAVNALNQAFIPSYTTYDLGFSLTRNIADRPMTFRLNGQNITSERYWASTGGLFLGQSLPAVVKFSIDTSF